MRRSRGGAMALLMSAVFAFGTAACSSKRAPLPPAVGSLAVTVGGLPAGAAASVSVAGPAGYGAQVTATQTLTDLAPGSYPVSAQPVASGGATYSPTVTGSPATVLSASSATVTVTYAAAAPPPSTGSLAVNVTGLPAGVSAPVFVIGPASYTNTLAGTQTLSSLSPGSYTVMASSVSSGGTSYTASVSGSPAAVIAGQTATVAVAYSAAAAPAAPTVTSLASSAGNANSGSSSGGDAIQIFGTNFTASATVQFGTVAATSVTFVSASELDVQTPAHDVGTVDVTVTTAAGTSASSAADQFEYWQITIQALPGGVGGQGSIIEGPDSNLWFAVRSDAHISTIDESGQITQFPLPHGDSDVSGLTAGSDSNLWYADYGRKVIGRMTTSGVVTEYPVPSGCHPFDIVSGPNFYVWFTEIDCPTGTKPKLSNIYLQSHAIQEFDDTGSSPYAVISGSNADLWFTSTLGLEYVTPQGSFSGGLTPSLPAGFHYFRLALAGSSTCFTEDGGSVGCVSHLGAYSAQAISAAAGSFASSGQLIADFSGNLWYTLTSGFGTMDPFTSQHREYVLSAGAGVSGIAQHHDSSIWMLVQDGSPQVSGPAVIRFANQ